jgi:E3 ubiquitin-protein ligase MYCBP2
MCMICFTEALYPIPSVLLNCGHVFHFNCVRGVLKARWPGPRITFGFTHCPICKVNINHPALGDLISPITDLYEDVKKKALMRLEYEGLSRCEAVVSQGARWFNNPTGFSMDRYAYYVCFKCGKAYFGGEARCDQEAGGGDTFNPEELVCGGCSDVSQAQMCPKHGTDYLEYKCRYCCSVAIFFCFGTTHFCNPCHDDFQRVANIPKAELPQCPVGPKAASLEGEDCPLNLKHPPTGEEFALGCGICRNAHTF